jgi:hypothetical protein
LTIGDIRWAIGDWKARFTVVMEGCGIQGSELRGIPKESPESNPDRGLMIFENRFTAQKNRRLDMGVKTGL